MADAGIEQVGLSVKIDGAAAVEGARKISAAFGRMRDASGRFVSTKKPVEQALDKLGLTARQAAIELGRAGTEGFGVSQALRSLGIGANQGASAVESALDQLMRSAESSQSAALATGAAWGAAFDGLEYAAKAAQGPIARMAEGMRGRAGVASFLGPLRKDALQAAAAIVDVESNMRDLASLTASAAPKTLAQLASNAKAADMQLQAAKKDADLLSASVGRLNLRSLSPDAARDLSAQVLRVKTGYSLAAEQAKRAEADFKNAFTRPQGAAYGLVTALGALGGIRLAQSSIETISSFEGIKSSLEIVTRDTQRAQFEFDRLAELAKKTPFTLEQVSKAFIRLRSAGLDATNESLIAYGDIAASIPGKQIGDVIEAVADAVQGQDRRLKELGGGLRDFGDQVEVTLGGMRLLVDDNATEIEKALIKLGQQKFDGAMLAQSKTIAGQFSNLRDQIDLFLFDLGEAGLSKSIGGLVSWLGSAAGGGRELAQTLGPLLGSVVDGLKWGLQVIAEHGKEISIVFGTIFAAGKVTAIISMVKAINLTTIGTKALSTAMTLLNATNPFGWVAIAIGALAGLILYIDDVRDAAKDLMVQFQFMYEAMAYLDHPAGKMGLAVIEKHKQESKVSTMGGIFSDLGAKGKNALSVGKSAYYGFIDKMQRAKPHSEGGKGESAAEKLATDLQSLIEEADSAERALGAAFGGATDAELAATSALEAFTRQHRLASAAQLASAEDAIKRKMLAEEEHNILRDLASLTRDAAAAEDLLGQAFGGATDIELKHASAIEQLIRKYPHLTQAQIEQAGADMKRISTAETALEAHRKYKEGILALDEEITLNKKRLSLIQSGLGTAQVESEMRLFQKMLELKNAGAKLTDEEIKAMRAKQSAAESLRDELEKADLAKTIEKARQDALAGALSPITDLMGRQFGFLEDSISVLVSGAEQFSDALVDGILEGKFEWDGLGKKILADLAKAALRAAVVFALKTGGKALLGTLTGGASLAAGGAAAGLGSVLASVLHQGGMAGSGPQRSVSASLFVGAPRYHQGGYAGLKPGEMAAVLQPGERVLTQQQQAQRRSGTRITQDNRSFSFTVVTPDADSFRRNSRDVTRQVARDIEAADRRGK